MTLATLDRYAPRDVARTGGHAVVLGASVAGTLAASVLADRYDDVTIVERDSLSPDDGAPRRVPQAEHLHVLHEGGRATVEDLLPGFSRSLLSEGGLLLDWSPARRYFTHGGYLADRTERVPVYAATRPLVESVIRRRVLDIDGVALRDGCRWIDYVCDGEAVTGVEVAVDGDTETVEADLVVDATGRSTRTPAWLAEHGFGRPRSQTVRVDLQYSTVTLERPAGDRTARFVVATPPDTRGGAVLPVEDDRWLVTCWGMDSQTPPTEPAALREFAADLPVEDVADLLEEHPWRRDQVASYRFPESLRRHYDAVERPPAGLLAIGDALASFNPKYGQGMTVAALQALALHHALASEAPASLWDRFYDRADEAVDAAWAVSVGADFRYRHTTGPKPRGTDVFNRYLARLLRRAHSDATLATAFAKVSTLERPVSSLLQPGVVWRVLRPSF